MEEKSNQFIVCSKENKILLQSDDKCDKYDYLTAVACGALGGIIDVFLVGTPGKSRLCDWSDAQVDNAVTKFAMLMGWKPKNEPKIAGAIGFLERKYSVNYDQRHSVDVNNAFHMTTKNHHMKSLAHSPDVVGLFFSILNQFTSTSTFIDNGQLITVKSDNFELQGGNFIAKLFCGIVNWLGHIMSDIAGSSGSRGQAGRGTGVVIPFYELFQLCHIGKFSAGKYKQELSVIAIRAFQEGYDLRFGVAAAIPVILTDLLIRLIWSLRRYFQYGKPLAECIPINKHSDLRVMLLFGNGTLCAIDAIDAGIRSGGDFLTFFMRLNLLAWFRFVTLVLKEICIRVGISVDALQTQIDAYKKINRALEEYLIKLKKINIQLFKEETKVYDNFMKGLLYATTEKDISSLLLNTFDEVGISKPWTGDFNEFMSDRNNRLRFE